MAGWRDLGSVWATFREIDIRPIREAAERPLVLAFVGAEGVGRSALISALHQGARAQERTISPTIEVDLTTAELADSVDLIVLVLDATRADWSSEAALCSRWTCAGRPVLVFFNKMDLVQDGLAIGAGDRTWTTRQVSFGSALAPASLANDFVPRLIEQLPHRLLSLSRHYPLFRVTICRDLIRDTAAANASYALGTGLAEVIPALNIPFNVADLAILSKNQALMAYKLGLALGLSVRWQDHVSELGGVVGVGFLWRQVARQLAGLVPIWGIVPKVAVAYAGTLAVGEAVLYWYRTGQKMSGEGMRELYSSALAQGRQVAQDLLARAPKPWLPKAALPSLARTNGRLVCQNCRRENSRDAQFCSYCATSLTR